MCLRVGYIGVSEVLNLAPNQYLMEPDLSPDDPIHHPCYFYAMPHCISLLRVKTPHDPCTI